MSSRSGSNVAKNFVMVVHGNELTVGDYIPVYTA